MFQVNMLVCFFVFCCQCQCNSLPRKSRLWNDLLYIEQSIKPYTLNSFVFSQTHCSAKYEDYVI